MCKLVGMCLRELIALCAFCAPGIKCISEFFCSDHRLIDTIYLLQYVAKEIKRKTNLGNRDFVLIERGVQ